MSLKSKLLNLLHIDSLIETVTGYLEKKIELVKIEVKEETAAIAAKIIIYMTLLLLVLFIVVFLSIVASHLLNHYFESTYIGHLIVAGIYLLLLIILLILRKTLDLEGKLEEIIFKFMTKKSDD